MERKYINVTVLKTELAKISLSKEGTDKYKEGFSQAMRQVSEVLNDITGEDLYTKSELDEAYERGNSYGAERVRSYSAWNRR